MKTLVVSYSLSGNNAALAKQLAQQLSAKHISLSEKAKRTSWKTFMDMLFNRMPEVQPAIINMDGIDHLILVGPVWMGKAPSPLRSCLQQVKYIATPYSFISISGAGKQQNTKVEKDLLKRVGKRPIAVIDKSLTDLRSDQSTPSPREMMNYRLTAEAAEQLGKEVAEELRTLLKSN